VTSSSEEISRLPVKSYEEHIKALNDLRRVHLGPGGCMVYDECPLIYRLFGSTPKIPCPNGRALEVRIAPKIEQQIDDYIANTR
jgi:hypothetical protein